MFEQAWSLCVRSGRVHSSFAPYGCKQCSHCFLFSYIGNPYSSMALFHGSPYNSMALVQAIQIV